MDKIIESFKPGFGSDNHSGVLPEVLEFLKEINTGHAHAYGGDKLTEKVIQKFKEHFGKQAEVFFVFNGTAANVLGCLSGLRTFESLICSTASHLHNDECGAPEKITGSKLISVEHHQGKIRSEHLAPALTRFGDQHYSQPKVLSITQPTELGTVYSIAELKALIEIAKRHHLFVHMDGARFANAAYRLGCSFQELTTDLGVDVLSLGGTKNGLLGVEAVVFLNPTLAKNFQYLRKQHLQLASKHRFFSGQFLVYLNNDVWKRVAEQSCKMADLLKTELSKIPSVKILYPVESNAVFVNFPAEALKKVRDHYFFYVWDEFTRDCRLMTSFDTTERDVRDFVSLVGQYSNK